MLTVLGAAGLPQARVTRDPVESRSRGDREAGEGQEGEAPGHPESGKELPRNHCWGAQAEGQVGLYLKDKSFHALHCL